MSLPLLRYISSPCPGVSRHFFFSPSLSSLSPLLGSVLVGSVLVYSRSACIVSTYCFHTLLVISYSVAVSLCSSHEVICIHASHPQNQIYDMIPPLDDMMTIATIITFFLFVGSSNFLLQDHHVRYQANALPWPSLLSDLSSACDHIIT
jgi:hypothetical protein